MASHEPFEHVQPKLRANEGSGIKLPIWLSTTKSRELTSSWCLQKECNIALESSWGELRLWFRLPSNRMLQSGDMSSQSLETPTRDNFGTPPWESREKEPFGCSLGGELQKILYGGRWWLPSSPGRGESSVSKCPWLVPTPKGVPKCELTLLWLVLDANSSEIILVPLPSLIPGLLAHPSTPFLYPLLVLEVRSGLQVPTFRNSTYLNPQVGLTRDLERVKKSLLLLTNLLSFGYKRFHDTRLWQKWRSTGVLWGSISEYNWPRIGGCISIFWKCFRCQGND